MSNSPIAVAYGGGVNSTAMLIGMRDRSIAPKLILFADTGGERPETYECLGLMSEWCSREFGIPIITVSFRSEKHGYETLEQECLGSKTLPSIAYGYKRCSLKWKVGPQDKYVNNLEWAQDHWKSGGLVIKAIGYDSQEERRAKIVSNEKYKFWYPLIEWGMWREECVELCNKNKIKTSKSSCFFCPSMKYREILDLHKNNKPLLERALEIEKNAEIHTVKGLGRSFSWRGFVDEIEAGSIFDAPQTECSIETPCGCYDGE